MQKLPSAGLSQFNWFDSQRLIFVAFFLLGAVGVIALKENEIGPFVTIAYSFAVMMIYIAFCGSRPYPIHADIIGDNIYYLGFLFTLVSLAYTLYKFTSTDSEIDQIIKNFGIALSTTLIGVVGRVYFNQTHDDGEHLEVADLLEQERLLHASLNDRTNNLIDEIDAIHHEMRNLKMSTVHSIQETTEASTKVFLENIQSLLAAHQKRLEQDQIERAATQESFTHSIESSSTALGGLAQTVRSTTLQISENITQSLTHYSNLNGKIQQEAAASKEAIEGLQNSLSRLGVMWGSESPTKK